MMKLFCFCIILMSSVTGFSQEFFGDNFSSEMRARFIADQDEYFKKLSLTDNQKRAYEEITRRYDKEIQNVGWSGVIRKIDKKRVRSLQKSKNKEMKGLLATDQYKLYLRRQKEIETKYRQ